MGWNGAEDVWEYLQGDKDLVLFFTAIVAIAVLLGLLLYDICKAKKSRNKWVPTEALVINALCLTLLGLLPRPFQSQSNDSQGAASYTSTMGAILLGQRVMMCVFMGYILPTLGNIRKAFSGDMVALLISLASTFYDIFIEVFAQWLNSENEILKTAILNTVIMVNMIHLLGLLCCAMLASIAIEDIANLKLCRLIRNGAMKVGNPSQLVNWEPWKCQMLGLCIMARTFQPSYLLARSVLASSIFFAVTISASTYFVGLSQLSRLFKKDMGQAMNIMFLVCVSVQSLFIVCGWCVICYRWMQSVIFYSKDLHHQHSPCLSQLLHFLQIENFWVRAAKEIQHNGKIHALADVKDIRLLPKVLRALRMHKLFVVGLAFQFILVWWSKFCCLFSKILVHPVLVVRVFWGSHAFHESRRLKQQLIPGQTEEFHILKDYLLILDGEGSLAVWVANLSFIDKIRDRLEDAKAKGNGCMELKRLLNQAHRANNENSCFIAERYVEPLLDANVKIKFDLQYLSIKMIAVSLLAIMFEVFGVYETVIWRSSQEIVEIENNIQVQKDILGKCIKAVEQAWKLLSFSESLSMETKRLSNTADSMFEKIKKIKGNFRWLNHDLPITQTDKPRLAVENLRSMAEKQVEKSCHNEFDCINWNHAVAGAHMQSICNKILMDQDTNLEGIEQIKGFLENLERLLASIVKQGILKTYDSLDQFLNVSNDCKNLHEREICKMCSAMAMVFGIFES